MIMLLNEGTSAFSATHNQIYEFSMIASYFCASNKGNVRNNTKHDKMRKIGHRTPMKEKVSLMHVIKYLKLKQDEKSLESICVVY